jgi:hypothetical protein
MKRLRFNICDLPSSFIPDAEVEGLGKRIEEQIGETLEYSCSFWAYHLTQCKLNNDIVEELKIFLEKKVIFWIEAMNLLCSLSQCGWMLQSILDVSNDYAEL